MLKKYKINNDLVTREGWALIVIDTESGLFATVSDWGNYAYLWTHPGCEFRKFLIGLEPDYLHGKLMHGRPDAQVYDAEGTKNAVLAHLEEINQEGIEEDGSPWEHYETEKLLCEDYDFDDMESFGEWVAESEMEEGYTLAAYVPNRQCTAFCTKVMPLFKKLLKEELAKEEQDKKDAEARQANPCHCVREEIRHIGTDEVEVRVLTHQCPIHHKKEAHDHRVLPGCQCMPVEIGVGTMQYGLEWTAECPVHTNAEGQKVRA